MEAGHIYHNGLLFTGYMCPTDVVLLGQTVTFVFISTYYLFTKKHNNKIDNNNIIKNRDK